MYSILWACFFIYKRPALIKSKIHKYVVGFLKAKHFIMYFLKYCSLLGFSSKFYQIIFSICCISEESVSDGCSVLTMGTRGRWVKSSKGRLGSNIEKWIRVSFECVEFELLWVKVKNVLKATEHVKACSSMKTPENIYLR